MRTLRALGWVALFSMIAAAATATKAATLSAAGVQDIFGRTLNGHTIRLVDWDGQMNNPAIKLLITPPPDAALPASAYLSADGDRLYFDEPSDVGPGGPDKTINFNDSTPVPVYLSIFPDRDGQDEYYTLTIQATDSNGNQSTTQIPIHVIDQDQNSAPTLHITVDFSQDQTGFFDDPAKRAIVQQAADDWAYFFDGTGLAPVPAGDEQTWIWDPYADFTTGHYVTNSSTYTGYLLYAYGIDIPELRSGGEGSYAGGFQQIGANQTSLRRSGGLEVETQGNFNTLGWFLTTTDDDWLTTENFGNEQNDLYSIVHHEIGHALGFNGAYPDFETAKNAGGFDEPDIVAYEGATVPIDSSDHLNGSVDAASGRGAFGYEYYGYMPTYRWLISKLDLLCLNAVGYPLRTTSAFVPLSLNSVTLPQGIAGSGYSQTLQASGGIPFYDWTLDSGALPDGLSLNSFTGEISGNESHTGTFNFTIRVRDYTEGSTGVTAPFSITIINPSGPTVTSVNVSPALAAAGEPVHVVVSAQDPTAAISGVTANGVTLSSSGSGTWAGDIPAEAALGTHSVTVVATDAAANSISDSSGSYRTVMVAGITGSQTAAPIMHSATANFLFYVWGRATVLDSQSFTVDDGSGRPVMVVVPGNTVANGDFVRARGVLDVSGATPTLTSSANLITKLN